MWTGILTNNHVLEDKAAASIAVATFATANKGTVQVALYPLKLWHTSPKEELDYSLVACELPPVLFFVPPLPPVSIYYTHEARMDHMARMSVKVTEWRERSR